MSHYARIDSNNRVDWVITADEDFIQSGAVGDPAQWIQTSYNTSGNVHRLGGTPFRKNFAGPGMIWDAERDAFYEPQPYPSWILDEDTCTWQAPVPRSGAWDTWDEATLSWIPGEDPTR